MAVPDEQKTPIEVAKSIHSDVAAAGLGRKGSNSGAATTSDAAPDSGSARTAAPVKVFISWAHSGESWNSDQAKDWAREVVEFAGVLRSSGIDADLDLFHIHEDDIDWTRYGPRQIDESDYVLVAISEAWAQRWNGTNSPTKGAGAVGEADALRGLFQRDQGAWQRKVMVVTLPSQADVALPDDLARATRFTADPSDIDSLEILIRTLTAQPLYEKPALGEVPVLPPSVSSTLRKPGRGKEPTPYGDYSNLLDEARKEERSGKKEALEDKESGRLSLLMGLLDALRQ
jgi:hypothetical protein